MLNVDSIITGAQQLLPDELQIARTWLTIHASDYDSAATNVLVGTGTDVGPSYPENYRSMYQRVTQRRIDIVAMKGLQPTIVELKEQIGLSALGQLIAYQTLYAGTFPGSPTANLLAVGWSIGPDVETAFQAQKVAWEIVPMSG